MRSNREIAAEALRRAYENRAKRTLGRGRLRVFGLTAAAGFSAGVAVTLFLKREGKK
ncbi:MAG: hypothetical protein FWG53_10185 [Clostridiales bacterium]|nr:hypothetical protein [Clostridiales bacterium]